MIGGSSGYGTVFKVNTDGTGYTVLKNFTGSDGANPSLAWCCRAARSTGRRLVAAVRVWDGVQGEHGWHGLHRAQELHRQRRAVSLAGLILSGSTLYGTTDHGGSSGNGTVFKVNTDGTGYTVLKNFTGSDGANP